MIPSLLVWVALLSVTGLALASQSNASAEGPGRRPEGGHMGEGAVFQDAKEPPLVMVGILARNTAHTLPNFFGYLEGMDYPKHRMAVW